MNVYHNENLWGNGKVGAKLAALPVNQTFLWEEQEIFIPAVYVGKAGAVLDVCGKIPIEDMKAFLKKWNKKRRLCLKTQEEYEQIEADNPAARNFVVEMSLEDIPLLRCMSSSLNWYPESVFYLENDAPAKEECENDKAAEKLMEAYDCDRKYCWHFERLSYDWKNEAILSPKKLSLTFQEDPIPVTAGYFTTNISDSHETIRTVQAVHPGTGQEYTLTLHECQQSRHSFADIGSKGVVYPEYFQTLSYSISPEIEQDIFVIRDCGESDQPRMADKACCKATSATAIFMAEKTAIPNRRMAASSMHFEPFSKVQWRIVFMTKTRDDIKICFPIGWQS